MGHRITGLMLDSLAIGICLSTIALCATCLIDLSGLAAPLNAIGPLALTLVWGHLSVFLAPFGTLFLLARMAH